MMRLSEKEEEEEEDEEEEVDKGEEISPLLWTI